jgi:hypothetical protein
MWDRSKQFLQKNGRYHPDRAPLSSGCWSRFHRTRKPPEVSPAEPRCTGTTAVFAAQMASKPVDGGAPALVKEHHERLRRNRMVEHRRLQCRTVADRQHRALHRPGFRTPGSRLAGKCRAGDRIRRQGNCGQYPGHPVRVRQRARRGSNRALAHSGHLCRRSTGHDGLCPALCAPAWPPSQPSARRPYPGDGLLFSLVYSTTVAWTVSFVVYHGGRLAGMG